MLYISNNKLFHEIYTVGVCQLQIIILHTGIPIIYIYIYPLNSVTSDVNKELQIYWNRLLLLYDLV